MTYEQALRRALGDSSIDIGIFNGRFNQLHKAYLSRKKRRIQNLKPITDTSEGIILTFEREKSNI